MSKIITAAFAFALVSGVLAAASLAETVSVTLGSGTSSPGAEVQIPLYITVSGDQKWEQIVATVEFPAVMNFGRANLNKDAAASGVTIKVKEGAPSANGQKKRMEVVVEGGKGKLLPAGLVGSLSFSIDKKARPQMVSLPLVEVRGIPQGSQAGVTLQGNPGSVAIYDAASVPQQPQPLSGCFFFTH